MVTLVLGAGGTVGMASHAGVLRALADVGFDASTADVVVGTSAGAVMGGLLRAGRSVDELWDLAHGRADHLFEADPEVRHRLLFARAWRTPLGLARRLVGSAWVLQRSLVRWPPLPLPEALSSFYRGGLVSPTGTRTRLGEVLGAEWPDRDLWLCTVDLVSGRRVVLGRAGAPQLGLAAAVRASSAVPGLFEPVKAGRRILVDGGVHSSTNADLAVRAAAHSRAGHDLVVVSAPMAHDGEDGIPLVHRLGRHVATNDLAGEVAQCRAAGLDVVVLAPGRDELATHGIGLLRTDGLVEVAEAAHEGAARALAAADVRRLLTREPRPSPNVL